MRKLLSGLPEVIADDEDLARFVTQSNQFSSSTAKAVLFLPNPKDRETSISRHDSGSPEKLWKLGSEAAGKRELYGAAIFKAHTVRQAQLEVKADEPPPYHGVITGWPWDDDEPTELKAKQKSMALVIASQATLLLR